MRPLCVCLHIICLNGVNYHCPCNFCVSYGATLLLIDRRDLLLTLCKNLVAIFSVNDVHSGYRWSVSLRNKTV